MFDKIDSNTVLDLIIDLYKKIKIVDFGIAGV